MNPASLRDYLVTHLPESGTEAARLPAFFARPDVADYMAQIEQLTGQIVTTWQQASAAASLPPAESPRSNPGALPAAETAPKPKRTYSFLAPREESGLLIRANGPNRLTPRPVAVLPPLAPADPVRFSPNDSSPAPLPARSLSIPNATVGKPYTYTLDGGWPGIQDLADHALNPDAAIGLTYDPDTRTLAGIPTEAGEFSFELTYRLRSDEPNRPALVRSVQLLVNPDPRLLWKDLPSDSSDPYYKPDSDQTLLAVDEVRLLAASVRGRSHAHEGKFRDDDFSLAYLADTGWYLLSVADGAGSASYSRRGAQLACETVTAYLQNQIDPQSWGSLATVIDQYTAAPPETQTTMNGGVQRQLYDVLGKAVFAAYKAIEGEARTKDTEPKNFATTLISVLARPVATGWFVGAFWVGDGGVGIYQTDREPIILGTPDGGEYAGQTRFLTMSETISSNFFARFRFALVTDFTAIVLMTDGITDPKFQTDSNLGRREKWDELWADLNQHITFTDDTQAPSQLQDWLTFWSPGNHDDRTIALLYTHADHAKN